MTDDLATPTSSPPDVDLGVSMSFQNVSKTTPKHWISANNAIRETNTKGPVTYSDSMPTCDYPTDSGSCGYLVHNDDAHCFMHDGSGTPPGHGAPTGNQNAVGNSGGGAPARNTNAEKYGSWSDPLKEYDRLDDRAQAFVEKLVRGTVERSKADLSEEKIETKARRLGVLSLMHSRGWAHALGDDGEGLAVKRERVLEDGTTVIGWVLRSSAKRSAPVFP